MTFKLKFTSRAEKSFSRNIAYLEYEWGIQVVAKFVNRVDFLLQIVASNPYLFPFYDVDKNIRKCVVNERVILFYRIKKESIEILLFWNTYQSPTALRF